MTQFTNDVEAAVSLGHEAREFRETVRWRVKPEDEARQSHIDALLDQIDDAMKPLRSHIGRLVWEPRPDAEDRALREASALLQYERRQLKKMRR